MHILSRRTLLKHLAGAGVALCAVQACASHAWAAAPAPTVPASPVPPTWYIPDNPAARDFRQQFNLSCEVASYQIVLMHYGFMDEPEELMQDVLGVNEDPNLGFRGDYRALHTNGLQNYGAHAPALAQLVSIFPRPGAFHALPLADLNQVRAALSHNWLVMAWIPVALQPSRRVAVKMSTGDEVALVPGEHVIVLHGYDSGGFYPYDPRPTPRVPGYVAADALWRGMSLFDQPALAIQPLF